jgi:L-lactate dehydrogenase complex protein LldG
MAERETFLNRVRQAAEQGRRYRVHSRPVPEGVGYLGAGGNLCQRFAAEVTAVGGEAFIVADLAAARQRLVMLLAESAATSTVCWQHELLDRLGMGELLGSKGIESLAYDSLQALPMAEQRQKLLAAGVGITSCDLAIAETGTLMMCSRPGHERVASLLPPMHIAIVEQGQIVPDLLDAFQWLADRGLKALPSNVTFITGPSKTGDIELQLTTGVHGPGRWRVIVIDSQP